MQGAHLTVCGGVQDRTIRLWNPHRGIHIKTYQGLGSATACILFCAKLVWLRQGVVHTFAEAQVTATTCVMLLCPKTIASAALGVSSIQPCLALKMDVIISCVEGVLSSSSTQTG